MSLRRRITLIAASSVAVAVAIAVLASYFAVRNQMVGQVDNELRSQAIIDQGKSNPNNYPGLSANAGGPTPYGRVVAADGQTGEVQQGITELQFPQIGRAQRVASGSTGSYIASVWVNGAHLRLYTFRAPGTVNGQSTYVAVQLARPLSAVDNVLSTLKWILMGVFVLVVALAAFLARLATRRVMRPLAEMTATAEAITETEDLDRRISVRSDDEVGQLARRFNEMLERLAGSRAALDESVTAQRQLVADASHELRTPVTSLRTNIEILIESGAVLDEEDRHRLLADVVEQSEELSTLVSDLIEVARGDLPEEAIEDTRLDRLVEAGVQRARRNSPNTPFSATLVPVVVQGSPERLNRAINNLLDNAAKHTETGTEVEVTVDEHGVTIRDHGGGLAEEDLPHVFDRFYRGANSRSRHGSGLGLAIVKQVAETHGGSVSVQNAEDGGAIFNLLLPTLPVGSAIPDDPVVPSHPELAAQ